MKLGQCLFTYLLYQQDNFTLMLNNFGSSHVLTPVSRQCLKSLKHFHYVSVSSHLDQIRNVSARLMSRYLLLANVDISVSEKKRLDSITAGQNRGKKQKFDRMSGGKVKITSKALELKYIN